MKKSQRYIALLLIAVVPVLTAAAQAITIIGNVKNSRPGKLLLLFPSRLKDPLRVLLPMKKVILN